MRFHLIVLISLTALAGSCVAAGGDEQSDSAFVESSPIETETTLKTTESTPEPGLDQDAGFIPPGAELPSDSECAQVVVATPEVRAENVTANATKRGPQLSGPEKGRVTGNFEGTTDEIIQWAACKWGLPADVARAQVATESWWRQEFHGDWTTNAQDCAPGHVIGGNEEPGKCPESIGLLQVKYRFNSEAFPSANDSSAYNLDYGYAVWRACFEGREPWLNDPDSNDQSVSEYVAGDAWGCIGRWFAGAWYTDPAQDYIQKVQKNRIDRVWESQEFLGHG